jgi:hypothetical protein
MTRSALLTASLALAGLLCQAPAARAQYPYGGNPYTRPAVSPYINLLRGGASPAINYSTLVRPELEFRSSINQLNNQTLLNQQAITGLSQQQYGGPLVTGAQVGFQNQGVYFNSLTGGPGGFGSLYGYPSPGAGFGGTGTGASVGFGGGAGLGGTQRSAFGGGAPAGAAGATAAPTPSRGGRR